MHMLIASVALLLGAAQPPAVSRADRIAAAADALVSLSEDPPRDAAHPARNRQLVIPSGPVVRALSRPAEMNALFFQAAGAGPHPTVLLLHGLPGNERNLDLAQAMRRAGWNVLTFTYRGAWGSEGRFSIAHAAEDTEAALDWLRADAARSLGVDRARIVVAGHSMGGYLAAKVVAEDDRQIGERPECLDICSPAVEQERQGTALPPVAGVILLDTWDIAAEARRLKAGGAQARAAFIAGFDDIGHALGPVTAADIADELIRRGAEWDLVGHTPSLGRMRVLTINAVHGNAEENRAVTDSIRFACTGQRPGSAARLRPCPTLTASEIDSDHAFADSRLALAERVVAWLGGLPPAR